MILHIVPQATWEAAQPAGVYEGDTLATQGYIHCSTEQQAHIPATALFRGRNDLLLLVIDESRLPTPITWEQGDPPATDGSLFPHLYAPLPLNAVTEVKEYRPAPDGTFGPPQF
ncbi:DUF952 domain-containing protein [Actinoplanes sp. TRM 88003]|uniref:DUF952 domain-containing protein n=1 Tax=Paractinoplanes aksuensis TaxID=2939490 RepID=A0ABT1DMB3_9ACTN|nr:DUF952 domain-containing protein [Actinoplanes aksuensis]MCO8271969.1 DUF952 domain-containing protein [Actinoplanes aksuensis]